MSAIVIGNLRLMLIRDKNILGGCTVNDRGMENDSCTVIDGGAYREMWGTVGSG